jgi:hypothetical protein
MAENRSLQIFAQASSPLLQHFSRQVSDPFARLAAETARPVYKQRWLSRTGQSGCNFSLPDGFD